MRSKDEYAWMDGWWIAQNWAVNLASTWSGFQPWESPETDAQILPFSPDHSAWYVHRLRVLLDLGYDRADFMACDSSYFASRHDLFGIYDPAKGIFFRVLAP